MLPKDIRLLIFFPPDQFLKKDICSEFASSWIKTVAGLAGLVPEAALRGWVSSSVARSLSKSESQRVCLCKRYTIEDYHGCITGGRLFPSGLGGVSGPGPWLAAVTHFFSLSRI